MNSYAAVLELLGYDVIKEVDNRIICVDRDGYIKLYIDGELASEFKCFEGKNIDEYMYKLWLELVKKLLDNIEEDYKKNSSFGAVEDIYWFWKV